MNTKFDDETIDELDEIDEIDEIDDDVELDDDVLLDDEVEIDDVDLVDVLDDDDVDDDDVDLVDDLQPEDIEMPLDALIEERASKPALDEEDEDEIIDEITGEPIKVVPRKENEFVCQSCFLVFQTSLMGDKKNKYCKDCA